MPLTIPTGFGQANFVFTSSQGTPPFVTTLGVDLGEIGGDFQVAAQDLAAAYAVEIMQRTTNQLQLVKCSLAVGQDGGGGSYESSGPPTPGNIAMALAPLSMAVIARKVTNLGGRHGRGRMFLPGTVGRDWITASGGLNPQDCLEPLQVRVNNFLAAIQSSTSMIAGPMPPVLLHANGSTPTPVTALPLNSMVGWIRGRIH